MNRTIRQAAKVSGEHHDWDFQTRGRKFLQKDGYEIYFHDDGFELTILEPDSQEREVVFECREIDTASPLYIAILEHTIANAESITTSIKNDG